MLSYVGATVGLRLIEGEMVGDMLGYFDVLGTNDGGSVVTLGTLLTDGSEEIEGTNDGEKLGRVLKLGDSEGWKLGSTEIEGLVDGMNDGFVLILG